MRFLYWLFHKPEPECHILTPAQIQLLCVNPPEPTTTEERDAKLMAEAYEEVEHYLIKD